MIRQVTLLPSHGPPRNRSAPWASVLRGSPTWCPSARRGHALSGRERDVRPGRFATGRAGRGLSACGASPVAGRSARIAEGGLAVCGLFSFLNPAHERKLRDASRPRIVCSCDVSPVLASTSPEGHCRARWPDAGRMPVSSARIGGRGSRVIRTLLSGDADTSLPTWAAGCLPGTRRQITSDAGAHRRPHHRRGRRTSPGWSGARSRSVDSARGSGALCSRPAPTRP